MPSFLVFPGVRLGISRSRTGSAVKVRFRSDSLSSPRNTSTPTASICLRVMPSTPGVRDPRLRFTRSHATSSVAGSQSRLNKSPKRLSSSCPAQRCSLVCHPSTRCSASRAESDASVFTPGLPNGVSCCGPAVRLRHAGGFPALGLLRGLRHAPYASADIAPCLPPPGRHAQGASHVHHDPFDRVGSRLYPCNTSGGQSQYPAGLHPSSEEVRGASRQRREQHRHCVQPMSARFRAGLSVKGLLPSIRFRSAFRSRLRALGYLAVPPGRYVIGALSPTACDSTPGLPPASPGRCINPGPASQPTRRDVVLRFYVISFLMAPRGAPTHWYATTLVTLGYLEQGPSRKYRLSCVPRTQKEDRCRTNRRMRCCMRDGGAGVWLARWSSAVVLQERAANRPELLRLRAVVVSVVGKGASIARQVWITKANASKPLMTCRNCMGDIKTRGEESSWDEPGGCLLIGQVVSGMEVARAWSWLSCGTWEPVVPCLWVASGAGSACGCLWKGEPQAEETVRGRVPMRGTGADHPVVAMMLGNAGGAKGMGRPGLVSGQPSLVEGAW